MGQNRTHATAENLPDAQNDPLGRAAEWVHIDQLIPWEKNPRKNDAKAPNLAKLIAKLGLGKSPVAWRRESGEIQIVGGHTTKKAIEILVRALPKLSAKQRSRWHPEAIRIAETGMLPVRVRSDLTESQAHQLAIADNKSVEWAEWDDELLAEDLSEFSLEDVQDLGFDPKEIDKLADDLYGLDDELDKGSKLIDEPGFSVVIDCTDEEQQLEVIAWAQERGLKCRALI